MANKQLKWYHYMAKVVLIAITTPIFPLLVLIGWAGGDTAFALYREMWNS